MLRYLSKMWWGGNWSFRFRRLWILLGYSRVLRANSAAAVQLVMRSCQWNALERASMTWSKRYFSSPFFSHSFWGIPTSKNNGHSWPSVLHVQQNGPTPDRHDFEKKKDEWWWSGHLVSPFSESFLLRFFSFSFFNWWALANWIRFLRLRASTHSIFLLRQ